MAKGKSNKTLKQGNRITEIKTNQDFNGQQPTTEQLNVKVKDPAQTQRVKRPKKKNRIIHHADQNFDDVALD
ncbi:MAG: hypothetical protein IPL12_10430 [Bacteroidetes bacterium]|nr:hypothetical protein [Bacteroidota bacterium]MBK8343679.1 hypothetical protein [Bacteroidota bacterium]